ncbi:uncharacterized protein LOC9634675 [Selaginella moellendorffii]|nr:uncharacterized protein LOC9634675 [Selaginella moellendorffii]|eukprot:XP_002965970.2 uncharacterized protein LOC9634675 [Selaginella moellendorffii]
MAATRLSIRSGIHRLAQLRFSLGPRFYATKQEFDDAYEKEDDEELRAGNADKFGMSNKQREQLLGRAANQRSRQQEPLPPMKWQFDMRVVDVNRTFRVTKAGGIQSFTAFVVCGNYEGIAGYGKGKASDVGYAVDKAYRRSLRNLHFFDIYMNRTIYHSQRSKFGATHVKLWPADKGVGLVASDVVGDILFLAGFKDMKSKVIGSRHPHSTVKALFKALCEVETPEVLPAIRPQGLFSWSL